MNYTRNSKTRYFTKEENLKFYLDKREYLRMRLDELGVKHPAHLLLDSSLITRTKSTSYDYKIIECGDYYQVYNYSEIRKKENSNLEKIKNKNVEKKITNIMIGRNTNSRNIDKFNKVIEKGRVEKDNSNLFPFFGTKEYDLFTSNIKKDFKNINISKSDIKKEIELKNINRSKLSLQRLVKSNEHLFKTFITLTFAENVKDVKIANKKFDNWRRMIKRKKSDFLYVCVPEFQKRGAVHYHLLTNLDIKENHDLIIPQENKKHQYDVKYWKNGFSSVFDMKDINVVGYISKYMTKDIDNRLWGHRRYFYSQKLKKPSTLFLNTNRIEDLIKLFKIMDTSNKKHKNIYPDKFGQPITFIEYKKRN